MKKSLFVTVLVILAVVLAACGGGDAIVGNWESVYISDGEASFKAVGLVKFEIKADKTFVSDSKGDKTEGTWKKDGDKYILTVEGDDVEAKIEKDVLAINFVGTSYIHFSKDAGNFKDYPEGVIEMNMDLETEGEEEK